jgi:hypothetical protein
MEQSPDTGLKVFLCTREAFVGPYANSKHSGVNGSCDAAIAAAAPMDMFAPFTDKP